MWLTGIQAISRRDSQDLTGEAGTGMCDGPHSTRSCIQPRWHDVDDDACTFGNALSPEASLYTVVLVRVDDSMTDCFQEN